MRSGLAGKSQPWKGPLRNAPGFLASTVTYATGHRWFSSRRSKPVWSVAISITSGSASCAAEQAAHDATAESPDMVDIDKGATATARSLAVLSFAPATNGARAGSAALISREIGYWSAVSVSALRRGRSVPIVVLLYTRHEIDARAPAERGKVGDVEKLARVSSGFEPWR